MWVSVEWLEAIVDALPARGVGIAFDDGNPSDLKHALGVLARLGRRARFFVLAGRVGPPGYLSEAQIATLHGAGMTIGSHGLSHRDWRTLPDEELHAELAGSRRALQELIGS